MKRFEYLSLGKELKAQIDIARKQYQKLDKTFEFDIIIKKEKPVPKKYNKSNLIYVGKYSIHTYNNISPLRARSVYILPPCTLHTTNVHAFRMYRGRKYTPWMLGKYRLAHKGLKFLIAFSYVKISDFIIFL